MIIKRIRHWRVVILILLLFAVNAWLIQRFPVSAAGETLTIAAPVVFSSGYTISSAKFIDNANTAYFVDPAATGDSLVLAGTATASGNLTVGNGGAIRAAFGPLSLQYKSGLDAWTTGLTLQDSTGNVGIGTTNPLAILHVGNATNNPYQLIIQTGSSGNSTGLLIKGDPWDSLALYFDSNNNGVIESPALVSRSLLFRTGGNERLRIDSTGNVGIGTTSPSTALQVVGTITGTTKNFEIDHPTKAGMKLIHSTIEGPEVAVFYRGEVRLAGGKAVVVLPEYFEALTRKEGRTVQLTAKNGWSPLYVNGEVTAGRFTVKADSGNPNQQFYWEVKAVRADVAPLVVEKRAN